MKQILQSLFILALAFTACSNDSEGLSKADVVSILDSELSKDSLLENTRDSVFIVKRDTVISIVNNRDTIVTIIGGSEKDTLLISSRDTVYIRDTVLWGGSENDSVIRKTWLSYPYEYYVGGLMYDSVYSEEIYYFSKEFSYISSWTSHGSESLESWYFSTHEKTYDETLDSLIRDYGESFDSTYTVGSAIHIDHFHGKYFKSEHRDTCISEKSLATETIKLTIKFAESPRNYTVCEQNQSLLDSSATLKRIKSIKKCKTTFRKIDTYIYLADGTLYAATWNVEGAKKDRYMDESKNAIENNKKRCFAGL